MMVHTSGTAAASASLMFSDVGPRMSWQLPGLGGGAR